MSGGKVALDDPPPPRLAPYFRLCTWCVQHGAAPCGSRAPDASSDAQLGELAMAYAVQDSHHWECDMTKLEMVRPHSAVPALTPRAAAHRRAPPRTAARRRAPPRAAAHRAVPALCCAHTHHTHCTRRTYSSRTRSATGTRSSSRRSPTGRTRRSPSPRRRSSSASSSTPSSPSGRASSSCRWNSP